MKLDMDTSDYQDVVLKLYLATHVGCQPPVTCADLARLQRAPEGTDQSTTGRCNDIIKRRSMRFGNIWLYTIMRGDCTVHAEGDRLRLAGNIRQPQRTANPLDAGIRYISDSRHTNAPLRWGRYRPSMLELT